MHPAPWIVNPVTCTTLTPVRIILPPRGRYRTPGSGAAKRVAVHRFSPAARPRFRPQPDRQGSPVSSLASAGRSSASGGLERRCAFRGPRPPSRTGLPDDRDRPAPRPAGHSHPERSPTSWAAPRFSAPNPGERYLPLGGKMILTGVRVVQVTGFTIQGAGCILDPGSCILKKREFRVDLEWLGTRPLVEDYIVKVDLVGPDQAWKVGSDSVPAGGAIPTLKWLRGSLVRDRHRLSAPDPGVAALASRRSGVEALAGEPALAHLELAVYDHFTQRVLPILDPGVALLGGTVPLGQVLLP